MELNGEGSWGLVDVGDGRFEKELRPEFSWRNIGIEQTDEHPVGNVTWNDSVAFCDWLGEKEGQTYALPTEAQWEFACRAGSTALWHFGDDGSKLVDYGWLKPWSEGKPRVVGQKLPNEFNVFDLHGNVDEWCMDWFSESYYSRSVTTDPCGPTDGRGRVCRGGDYLCSGTGPFTSWLRAAIPATEARCFQGFRPVMLIDLDSP